MDFLEFSSNSAQGANQRRNRSNGGSGNSRGHNNHTNHHHQQQVVPRGVVVPNSLLVAGAAQSAVEQVTTFTKTVHTTSAAHHAPPAGNRKQLIFCLAQDVSGSMSGGKMRESMKGLDVLHDQVFQPEDLLSVVTFASDVQLLHRPMVVRSLDRNRDKSAIQKNVGGCTALYDAIGLVIENIRNDRKDAKHQDLHRNAVYELLVITDGEDTSSRRFNLSTISALVAEPGIPNFHLTILGVGMSGSEAAPIKQQLCAPRHAKFLDVSDCNALNAAIQRVAEEVLQRVTVTVTTTTVHSATAGVGRDASGMHKVMQGFSNLALTASPAVATIAMAPHGPRPRGPRGAANFHGHHSGAVVAQQALNLHGHPQQMGMPAYGAMKQVTTFTSTSTTSNSSNPQPRGLHQGRKHHGKGGLSNIAG